MFKEGKLFTYLYSIRKLKVKKNFPLKLLIRKEKVTFLICETHSKLQEEKKLYEILLHLAMKKYIWFFPGLINPFMYATNGWMAELFLTLG